METFAELVRLRRSVRRFDPRPLDQHQIDILSEALLRAPSSRSRYPWHFVLVQNRQRLEELSRAKAKGAAFLAHAALGVAVVADPEVSDVWTEDCSIAAAYVQLQALDLGLGSTWAQMRLRAAEDGEDAEQVVRRILQLPEHYRVEAVIGIGYPAESPQPVDRDALLWDRIHSERF